MKTLHSRCRLRKILRNFINTNFSGKLWVHKLQSAHSMISSSPGLHSSNDDVTYREGWSSALEKGSLQRCSRGEIRSQSILIPVLPHLSTYLTNAFKVRQLSFISSTPKLNLPLWQHYFMPIVHSEKMPSTRNPF